MPFLYDGVRQVVFGLFPLQISSSVRRTMAAAVRSVETPSVHTIVGAHQTTGCRLTAKRAQVTCAYSYSCNEIKTFMLAAGVTIYPVLEVLS